MQLATPFVGFTNNFKPEVVFGLKIIADRFSKIIPEKELDEDFLSSLLADIEELVRRAKETEIEEDVKVFILKALLDLKRAVEEYNLLGVKPIEQVVKSNFGEIIINHDKCERSRKDEVGIGFWEMFSRVASVITVFSFPPALDYYNTHYFLPDDTSQVIEAEVSPSSVEEESIAIVARDGEQRH